MKKNNPLINPDFLAQVKQIELPEAQELTKINLSAFNLTGQATISGFPNLKAIDLSINELTDLEIKQDSTTNLQVINLGFNHLNNLNFLKQINLDLIKSLILNDNYLNKVTMDNFYPMLNLVELNLSNQENLQREKGQRNTVIIDIDNDYDNSFCQRLGSGLIVDNAEVYFLDSDPDHFAQTANSLEELETSSVSYKWYLLTALFGLVFIFIYLLIKKAYRKVKKDQ